MRITSRAGTLELLSKESVALAEMMHVKLATDMDDLVTERPKVLLTPEHELLAAILWGAISDARAVPLNPSNNSLGADRYAHEREKQREEAVTWIFSSNKRFDVGRWSFEGICQELNLNVASTREGIKAVIEDDVRRGLYRKIATFKY